MLSGLSAVSYTHLDVYKRQVLLPVGAVEALTALDTKLTALPRNLARLNARVEDAVGAD